MRLRLFEDLYIVKRSNQVGPMNLPACNKIDKPARLPLPLDPLAPLLLKFANKASQVKP